MGSPRSGSTWLLRLLSHHQRVIPLDEPQFGYHVAPLESVDSTISASQAPRTDYCLSAEYEDAWRPLLRALILKRVGAQVERASRTRQIDRPLTVLKEPNSSHAADLIMSLVPGSRLVFLLRDGRDVIDSVLDATSGETWMGAFGARDERERLDAIRLQARHWLYNTNKVQHAFAAHAPERRFLVRYEELLADPLRTLGELLRWAGLATSEDELWEMVSRESFASIPPEKRGTGKFFRAAAPGLWRENLAPGEQQVVSELLGEKLEELGYEV
ncbi:MAG: sulfotransferase [Actinomycetota bacterium]|nr:sulfotransferase [Actinomycetota bacterium]MDQ3720789.1 sulfotransferase [Actinomycetota bacterium]